jgi:hypothetical protein
MWKLKYFLVFLVFISIIYYWQILILQAFWAKGIQDWCIKWCDLFNCYCCCNYRCKIKCMNEWMNEWMDGWMCGGRYRWCEYLPHSSSLLFYALDAVKISCTEVGYWSDTMESHCTWCSVCCLTAKYKRLVWLLLWDSEVHAAAWCGCYCPTGL